MKEIPMTNKMLEYLSDRQYQPMDNIHRDVLLAVIEDMESYYKSIMIDRFIKQKSYATIGKKNNNRHPETIRQTVITICKRAREEYYRRLEKEISRTAARGHTLSYVIVPTCYTSPCDIAIVERRMKRLIHRNK